MGTVHQARDRENGRSLALKILFAPYNQREAYLARLKEITTAVTRLNHPHIAPIYEIDMAEGKTYLALPYFSGGTLKEKLVHNPENPAALLPALSQVASALDAAHAISIVHKDIKPANILFDEQGAAYVMDFGLIQIMDMTMHALGLPGTLTYMSPEQFTDAPTGPYSDQYSLAVIAYEALTGAPPFSGNMAQLMYKHVHEPPPTANLTPAQTAVFHRALAKQPADRFATVSAFITALQETMPAVAAAPEQVDPDATFVALASSPLFVEEVDEPFTADATFIVKPQPEVDETFITPVPPLSPAQADATVMVEPGFANAQSEPHYPANPGETFVVDPRPSTFPAAAKSQTPEPAFDPGMTFIANANQLGDNLISGAGGTTTAVKTRKVKGWHIALVGGVMAVALLAAALLWWRSRQPASPVETIADAPPRTTSTTGVIHFSDPAADMVLLADGEGITIPADGRLPLPEDGQALHLAVGGAPISMRLPQDVALMAAAGSAITFLPPEEGGTAQILLENGRLAASTENTLVVRTPLNSLARLENGVMGVGYQETPFLFDVDCFSGSCVAEDLEAQPLVGGEGTGIGDNGRFIPPQPAHHENYIFAPLVSTPTATPPPATTATSEPALIEETAVVPEMNPPTTAPSPTAEPTAEPTATPSPTPTATFVPRFLPRPVILNYTCAAISERNRNDTLFFEWSWDGALRGGEYLEVRVGPQGATNLSSVGRASADHQQGNNWRMPINAATFFQNTAYDYHWEVVHMHENGSRALARSERGCLRVTP